MTVNGTMIRFNDNEEEYYDIVSQRTAISRQIRNDELRLALRVLKRYSNDYNISELIKRIENDLK